MKQELYNLVSAYCDEYSQLRQQNIDLSNLAFHRSHGLQLKFPQEWNLLKVVSDIAVNWDSIAILYPCTATFRAISDHVKKSEDQIAYMSWHEIYTAAHLANSDVRHMQRVKQVLKDLLDLEVHRNGYHMHQ